MLTAWLSILLLLLTTSQCLGRDKLVVRATYDHDAKVIEGTLDAQIEKRDAPLMGIRLQLYSNVFDEVTAGEAVTINSITVGEIDLTQLLQVDGTDAWLPFPASLNDTLGPLTVTMGFRTEIPSQGRRTGWSANGVTLEAWHPLLAPWIDGEWYRVEYRDFLEPAIDLVDLDVQLRIPDSFQVIAPSSIVQPDSNGFNLLSVNLRAAQVAPVVLSTEYAADSSQIGDVSLRLYYREAREFIIDSIRTAVETAVNYMEQNVSAYPHEELVIVVGGLEGGGGLELPRMILASDPGSCQLSGLYRHMIVHEVVHQWFYASVNSYQAIWPWMDESVTEYFATSIGTELGTTGADLIDMFGITATRAGMNRSISRPQLDLVEVGRQGCEYYDVNECYDAVYGKGTLILATLTAHMGPERERDFWKSYATEFAHDNVVPQDFFEAIDKFLPEYAKGGAAALMDRTRALEYSITGMVSVPVKETTGDDTTDSAYEARIEYSLTDPLPWPIDLTVSFYDGTSIDTTINPVAGRGEVVLRAKSPAMTAIIDPHHKFRIDSDLLNNSISRDQSRGAGLRLLSGVTFIVESIISMLWAI